MNSSLLPGIGRRAVGQLAGQVQAVRHRGLARHRLRGRARRLARLRRQRDALDDLRARGAVLEQEALQRRADGAVDGGLRLRAAQPLLRLALELRLLHVHRQDADDSLADVLAVSVTPLGARFSCSMNARTALTIAARKPCSCVPPCVVGMPFTYERIVSSCDSVHCSVGFHAEALLARALEVEHLRRRRRLAALCDHLAEEVGDAARVLERSPRSWRLVDEDDRQALVEERLRVQRKRIVSAENDCLPKISGSGPEEDPRAGAARRADLLQLRRRLAALVGLLPARLVALHLRDHLSDSALTTDDPTPCRPPENSYCDEPNLPPACSVVSTSSSADFLCCFLMSTGMPRPVVVDGDGLAVPVQRHLDARAVAVDHLVDGVVDDLPQQVMVALAVGAADVHARAAADRLQALQYRDVL
jgi:hypothetical protein